MDSYQKGYAKADWNKKSLKQYGWKNVLACQCDSDEKISRTI